MADRRECYVCGGDIRGGAVYIGEGLYRHRRCAPLGKRYMRNPRLRRRALQDFGGISLAEFKRRGLMGARA